MSGRIKNRLSLEIIVWEAIENIDFCKKRKDRFSAEPGSLVLSLSSRCFDQRRRRFDRESMTPPYLWAPLLRPCRSTSHRRLTNDGTSSTSPLAVAITALSRATRAESVAFYRRHMRDVRSPLSRCVESSGYMWRKRVSLANGQSVSINCENESVRPS